MECNGKDNWKEAEYSIIAECLLGKWTQVLSIEKRHQIWKIQRGN